MSSKKQFDLFENPQNVQAKELLERDHPRVQRNYLEHRLTDRGLKWVFNGEYNMIPTGVVNAVLNPEEYILKSVGVWHCKRNRDRGERQMPHMRFISLVPYLIEVGRRTVADEIRPDTNRRFDFQQYLFDSELGDRLKEVPELYQRQFVGSFNSRVKMPGRGDSEGTFWAPTTAVRDALDLSSRNKYLVHLSPRIKRYVEV